MGDVGEFVVEEVSFLKAGANSSGPPVDYGWPQKEGTANSGISGAPHTLTNPFTSAASLQPLRQFNHTMGGNAVIGGYVYHGPVTELQDKFFYSDFVRNGQVWMLNFDRNTPAASYNGNNGTNTDVTALWQSLVYDPTDPSYMPESTAASSAGLDHLVSFGEDNAGNLYLVDFGNGSGFSGQYPGPGLGEIFRVVPDLLAGDYNSDGTVDAADYVIWRKTVGTATLNADGDGDGDVDQNDLAVWKSTFGNSSGAAAGAGTIPEPASYLILAALLPWVLLRRTHNLK
jgi:hypothetical protein